MAEDEWPVVSGSPAIDAVTSGGCPADDQRGFIRPVDGGSGMARCDIGAFELGALPDLDGDGFSPGTGDCDDTNPTIFPNAPEICDGLDNDCDGQVDEGGQSTFYQDSDGDGFGNASITTHACSAPAGYVSNATDCNDTAPAIHPGASEVCDGQDNDCNGQTDEIDTTPPVLSSVSATPNVLWPPNNQMRAVTISVVVSDACDAAPLCAITGVSSNEGNASDWQITGPLSVNLRATRNGNGKGRVYTVQVHCADQHGNRTLGTTTVQVPHDQGKGK